MSNQSGQGSMIGCGAAAALALITILVVIVAFSSCSSDPKQRQYGQTLSAEISTAMAGEGQKPMSGNITTPIVIVTATPEAAFASEGCVPPPTLIDPAGGIPFEGTQLTFAWKSDHALKPGETFDVFVSPNATELVAMNDLNQPAIVGRTTDTAFPIDLLKWRYAGTLGKFLWTVRIANTAGAFEDCAGEPAPIVLHPILTPIITLTKTPTRTPTPTWVPCIPQPGMFDPPDGKSFAAKNMILRWRTDYALKPDEEFAALAWMEGDAQPTVLTRTRDKIAPLDLLQWAFAGKFGKFSWNVRIQRTDGTVLSCVSPAFSFTLTGYTPESGSPQGQPKPPCSGIGLFCP